MGDDPLSQHHYDYHAHLYHLHHGAGAIGEWHIQQVLGRGGYGAVAKASHSSGQIGALKLTHPIICHKEVDILQRFGGDSIPRLLEAAIDLPDLGFPASCYVMELADHTLAQHFEGNEISPVPSVRWCSLATPEFQRQVYNWMPYERREREALAVANAVLIALETAESHVHGDVCPSNVLLFATGSPALQAKLADWGNARAYLNGQVDYTLIGGKELWCPPRTRAHALNRPGATFEPPNDRIDIYGLGALVCWMLTGTVPDQLARWEARKDPKSPRGLPLDQVHRAWRDFLVATTRADRQKRADPAEAAASLAEVRSRVHNVPPIAEPRRRAPAPVTVTPAPAIPSKPVAQSTVTPAPMTPATVHSPARRVRRPRPRGFAAFAVLALLVTTNATAATAHPPSAAPPPVERTLCAQADLLCTADALEPLVKATGPTWPDGLQPDVHSWYRGAFSRSELVEDASVKPWGAQWVNKSYNDLAMVRVDFGNAAKEPRTIAAAGLGLIVAVDDPARIPDGILRVFAAGAGTPGKALAWIPPLPPAATRYSIPRLLPAAVIPPDNVTRPGFGGLPPWLDGPPTGPTGDPIIRYPFTMLFDLTAISGTRIVGLGGGTLVRSPGTADRVILTGLVAAPDWPTEKNGNQAVFDDLRIENPARGGCYVDLTDAGFMYGRGYARFNCDQAHTVEVIDTPSLPPEARGPDDMVADSAASGLCYPARLATYKLDAALNAIPSRIVPSQSSRKSEYFTVLCLAASRDSSPLWFGPKTQAAIEASR